MLIAFTASAQIYSSALNTGELQLVPRDQVPFSGTFWVEGPTGMTAPLPCLPANAPDAPIYALPNGQFFVDARESLVYALSVASQSFADTSEQFSPLDNPQPDPPLITSNAWFNQIVISNHTYVSLGGATLDGNGNVIAHQFPFGVMFPVTATNLTIPIVEWQPIGQTNAIGNSTFEIPYNPASKPISFYRICSELDTNFNPASVLPFSLAATNLQILTDYGVALTWTNGQPGLASESEAIVETGTNGHAYLIDSEITSGASGSFSFELQNTNGLTFVRYSAPAATVGDQFFPPTNFLQNPDVFTIPYVINTNSGRSIADLSAYDVTDPSNPRFLAQVPLDQADKHAGTLEIPGISLQSGVLDIQLRATDTGNGESVTDLFITNHIQVSVIAPVLDFESNGSNRTLRAYGGYAVSLEAVTTNTTGYWVITTRNPNGIVVGQVSSPVASIGQHIVYNDGGTETTDEPYDHYFIDVTVQPTAPLAQLNGTLDPPAPPSSTTITVYLLPRRVAAAAITGYDTDVLPSDSGDRQFVLSVLQNGESELSDFIYYPVAFDDGNWKLSANPYANSLNNNGGWTSMQASLVGTNYQVTLDGTSTRVANSPTLPLSFLAAEGHGIVGNENWAFAFGMQGPPNAPDSDFNILTVLDRWHYKKSKDALAITIFTGCRIGGGNQPFPHLLLRNNGLFGQIDTGTAAAKGVRPCFGLAWTSDVVIGTDQFSWMSYWTLFATYLGGSGTSPFQYSLDDAIGQASFYDGQSGSTGGDNVTWSGTQGKHLDQFAQ